ncbi:MAG: TonB-dependent receptor [Proteobacteria bacterium]|nr:TonB-dependent receptor [Pseudomonadota bacterium]
MNKELAKKLLLVPSAAALLLWMPLTTAQAQSVADTRESAAHKEKENKKNKEEDEAELQAVIVTAARLAVTARNEQRNAANLINVQSAEDLAKYPDFDAAEALGRIPGLTMAGDTGEGRFVSIRGMDGNFNGATFGGVTLLNTNPYGTYFSGSGRAVEFDTIPLGAIDRIVVTKTGLPDRDAEGLGGSIELTPRSAAKLNRALFIEGTVGGGYENAYPNFAPFRAEFTVSGRVGEGGRLSDSGPLSFVLTASESDDRRRFDDLEADYLDDPAYPNKAIADYQLRHYSNHRKRFGLGAALEYNPNDRGGYYVRYSVAGYTEYTNRMKLIFDNMGDGWPADPAHPGQVASPDPSNPNGFIAPAATLTNELTNQKETHKNTIVAFGGHNNFGGALLEYEAAYSRAIYAGQYGRDGFFSGSKNLVLAYDNISSPNYPTFRYLNGVNPADPTLYTFSGYRDQVRADVDQQPSYKADFSLPVHLLSDTDQIKLGVKAGFRNKTADHKNIHYDILPAVPLTSVLGGGPYTNFYNRYDIGYQGSGVVFSNPLIGRSPAQITSDAADNASAYFNDKETIYAGYAQYTGAISRELSVLTGVRVEKTEAQYGAYTVDTNAQTFTPTTRSRNYTNAFPTLQLRYEPTKDLVGRLTYSTGISRPGFLQSSSSTQVDFTGGTVTAGNPDLRPTTGRNYDLSLEYYLPDAGILSFGAFAKTFTDFIVTREVTGPYPGIPGEAKFFTFENIPSAWARGLEVSYQQKFTFLPDPLDDLGVTLNGTLVDSGAHIRPGENNILPGTSRYTGNLGLYYDNKKVSAQLSLQYIAKSLFGAGGSAATDVYEDWRTTLDFTSRYFVTRAASVYFNMKNLSNSPLRFYEGSTNRPIQREYYEQTFEAGLSVSF